MLPIRYSIRIYIVPLTYCFQISDTNLYFKLINNHTFHNINFNKLVISISI